MSAAFCEWRGETLVLRLRVQPRAAKDGFAEALGDRVKLRITAPPVDGKANAHIVSLLADAFGVPRGRVRITHGESGRNKTVEIEAPRRVPPPFPHQPAG